MNTSTTTPATKTTWKLDATHSELGFKIKHLMITNVTGYFTSFDVTAEVDEHDFSTAKIDAEVAVSSINTNNEQRDGHLRNSDFFEAEKFPTMRFKSTEIKKVDDDVFELLGDLTIKDTTKPVKLVVEYSDIVKDPYGNTKAGFSFSGKINRKDWGISFNAALETGGVMLGEEVKIFGELQLIKQ